MPGVANQSMPLEHCLLHNGSADVDSVDKFQCDSLWLRIAASVGNENDSDQIVDFKQRCVQATREVTVWVALQWFTHLLYIAHCCVMGVCGIVNFRHSASSSFNVSGVRTISWMRVSCGMSQLAWMNWDVHLGHVTA